MNAFLVMGIIILSSLSSLNLYVAHPQIASGYSSEPLITTNTSVTRSITFPFLNVMGKADSSLNESITWNLDGTTNISDSRGNSFTFAVPMPSGTSFTLLQNSTTVDQKVTGASLQYDIYWKPVQNSKGIVDTYKFSIAGTSTNGATLQFPIKSSENFAVKTNEILVTKANNPSTEANGLGIDWSDAVSAGYASSFDSTQSSLDISVGKSFSIDPTLVANYGALSPGGYDFYEGERRVVSTGGNNLFAFYYNSSNIVYKESSDRGSTWGASTLVGTGTGPIASDNLRWTIGITTSSGTQYISVVYWVVSGNNTLIKTIRGTVSSGGTSISWGTPSTLLTKLSMTSTSCIGGVCAGANEATATNGTLFLTVRWQDNATLDFFHQEFKSTDGGNTFSSTDSATNTGGSIYDPEFVLARLANGNMLLVEATYASAELQYSVYSSSNSTWHSPLTTSGSGMSVNETKQISADSNGTNYAHVAYITAAPPPSSQCGTLKVAKWKPSGAFDRFETANNQIAHCLPSITITPDNLVYIYTLSPYNASGKVWQTVQQGAIWGSTTNPFGTTFNFPDEITSAISYPAAIWLQTAQNYNNVTFGTDNATSAPTGLTAAAVSSSQINLSWTAPSNTGGAPITGYKIERSSNGGSTWSTIVSNTDSTATTYSDTGLAASTTYTYRVSAINSAGTSSPSDTASATTLRSNWASSTGILAPVYTLPYPDNCCPAPCNDLGSFAWENATNAKGNYTHVPLIVIMNPDSGPGSGQTCDYVNAIQKLHSKGILVLGYVDTLYADCPPNGPSCGANLSSVEGQILNYSKWYGNINGIMMDEMWNGDCSQTNYYQTLTNYAKSIDSNFTFTVGNPGADTNHCYIGTVNNLVIYEDTGLPQSNSTLQGTTDAGDNALWHTNYDKKNFSFVSKGIESDPGTAAVQGRSMYVGYLYLTNNCPDYDYNCISDWLSADMGYLNKTSTLLTILSEDTSNNPLTSLIVNATQSDNLTRNGTTTLAYNVTSGWPYSITANTNCINHYQFNHWDNSAPNPRPITPTQNTNYTAYYNGC